MLFISLFLCVYFQTNRKNGVVVCRDENNVTFKSIHGIPVEELILHHFLVKCVNCQMSISKTSFTLDYENIWHLMGLTFDIQQSSNLAAKLVEN